MPSTALSIIRAASFPAADQHRRFWAEVWEDARSDRSMALLSDVCGYAGAAASTGGCVASIVILAGGPAMWGVVAGAFFIVGAVAAVTSFCADSARYHELGTISKGEYVARTALNALAFTPTPRIPYCSVKEAVAVKDMFGTMIGVGGLGLSGTE